MSVVDAREVRRLDELARDPARILSAAEAARRMIAPSPSDELMAAVRGLVSPWEAAFVVEVAPGGGLACFAVLRSARGESRERVAAPGADAEWLAAFAALGAPVEVSS